LKLHWQMVSFTTFCDSIKIHHFHEIVHHLAGYSAATLFSAYDGRGAGFDSGPYAEKRIHPN